MATVLAGAAAHAQVDSPLDPSRLRPPTSPAGADGAQRAPGSAIGASAASGLRGPLTVVTGVRGDVVYTDNARLAPKGREESEVRYELAPYLTLYGNTLQTQGYLHYAPRYIVRTLEGESNELRHDLSAWVNHFLYRDNVGIRATADVFDANRSAFGTTSVDPSTNPSNRTRYTAFSVSPYVRGKIGEAIDGELRYRADYIDEGENVEYEVIQRVSGVLGNVSGSSRFGWRALGTVAQSDFEGGLTYERATATALAYYVFSPVDRIGLGVTCNYNSILLDENGNHSACGPAASAEFRPTPRTAVGGYVANALYGNTGSARITHFVDRWIFGLIYRQGVADRGDSATQFIDPLYGFDGDGTLGYSNRALLDAIESRQRGSTASVRSSLTFGGLTSAIVRERALNGTLGYAFGRTSYGANAFYLRQTTEGLVLTDNLTQSVGTPTDLEQRGLDLNANYRINPSGSLLGGYRVAYTQSDALQTRSRLDSYNVGYRHDFTRSLSGALTYRFTTQRAEGPAAVDYDENAVILTLDYRF